MFASIFRQANSWLHSGEVAKAENEADRQAKESAEAQEAYRRAYERHWSAVRRGDTRSIHETRPALLAAQVRRLKVGA